jgi:putative ABC transport system substrate-binding protein
MSVGVLQKFSDGMREFGYVEGRNFKTERRFADGYMDRLPKLAAELVEAKPAIIVAASSAQAVAMRKATSTIPIVVPALGDAVALGLIASEARPGGNVTGIAPYVKGLPAKQLEVAREIVPGAIRIGLIDDATDVKGIPQRREIEAVATEIGAKVIRAEVHSPNEMAAAFDLLASERTEVVIVLQTSTLLNERSQIAVLAAAKRLPAVYGYGQHVDAGGLISYGIDLPACFHRAAYFVDKIVKGSKPGDLPVEFPTKVELAVNLKTANAIGLKIPSQLLLRADRVIE